MEKTVRRYVTIDLAKALFTMMIAVFHLWAHYEQRGLGGFIAVEFFFLVSGFFLMEQHDRSPRSRTPLQYTWSRAKKFYPHYIFSFLMLFLWRYSFQNHYGLAELGRKLTQSATEISMLYGTILSDEKTVILNSSTWYISILLIVGYVLWALLDRHEHALLTAAPVASFWIYAYMAYTLGTTNNWRTHVFGVLNYAALRAVAGMLLGAVCYRAHQGYRAWVEARRSPERTAWLSILAGAAVMLLVAAASYRWYRAACFFYIACFALSTVLLTGGESALAKADGKAGTDPASPLGGGVLLAVYLNHYLVIKVLVWARPVYHPGIIPVYLVLLTLYSIITSAAIHAVCLRLTKKRG